jgi:hypothetical protein
MTNVTHNSLFIFYFNLPDGTVLLLITGRTGMSILCNFSCALSVGGDGYFCVKHFICRLSMIILHSCIVLSISF